MNSTVAVALITALSTLTAAGLTGMISAWLNGRQLMHQRLFAREQRADERTDARREIRRRTYEHFLSQADEVYRVLDAGWFAAPFTEYPRWEGGFAARRALDEANVRVQLEGPEVVAAQAINVVSSIGREFQVHRRIFDAHSDAVASAAELDRSARSSVLKARFHTTGEFVMAARQTLGEPAPAMPSDELDAR